MGMRTVKDLKEFLQEQLDILEDYDDDMELKLKCNTYRIGDRFLGIAGYDGGYIDFNCPVREQDEEE